MVISVWPREVGMVSGGSFSLTEKKWLVGKGDCELQRGRKYVLREPEGEGKALPSEGKLKIVYVFLHTSERGRIS